MIKAELRRLMHKKKDWMYFGILYTLFLALIFFLKQKQNIDASAYMTIGQEILSMFFVLVIGSRIFTSVYVDDIASRKYTMILSHRKKTYQYLFEKTLISLLYTVIILFVSWLFYTSIFMVLYRQDVKVYTSQIKRLFEIARDKTVLSLVYMNLAAVMGYYFKKASSAKGTYIILAMNFVGLVMNVASLFSEKISKISEYMLSQYLTTMASGQGKISILLLIIAVYYGLSYFVSYLILEKKDLA